MTTIANSYIIVAADGKAQEVADAITKLAKDQNRKDVKVGDILTRVGILRIDSPADFIPVIQKELGDKIVAIEPERLISLPEQPRPEVKGSPKRGGNNGRKDGNGKRKKPGPGL